MLIAHNLFNVTIKFIIRIKQQPSHSGEDERFLGGRVESRASNKGSHEGFYNDGEGPSIGLLRDY